MDHKSFYVRLLKYNILVLSPVRSHGSINFTVLEVFKS